MKLETCFKLIGQFFSYYISGEEKLGRLIRIGLNSDDSLIVGIDEDGYIEEYDISEVQVDERNIDGNNLLKQIVKRVTKDINSFKYDLVAYHKHDVSSYLINSGDIELREYISDYLDNRVNGFEPRGIYERIIERIKDKGFAELICGLIAYKQHDTDTAYRVFSNRWIKEKNNLEYCRDFILVADEFKNDVLCFYLLKQYFSRINRYSNEKYTKNFWWKYVYYAVKYNNFDLIENMEVSENNVRLLIDSYIYIFNAYNLDFVSRRLTKCFVSGNNTVLQENNEDFSDIGATIDDLCLCKSYFPATIEGYYVRFEKCIKEIIDMYERGQISNQREERSGYVYEYVKTRNYGFIIGFDFQEYFFHWDYTTQNLRKRIMENIYSKKTIDEEERILVHFKCEYSDKKNQAIEII